MSLETTPTMSPDSADRSELIEKIFERVEAESARRAEEEAAEAALTRAKAEAEAEAETAQLESQEADDSVPSPVSPVAAGASAATVRQRRRGSVSVSRFGMPTESTPEPVSIGTPLSPSTRPSRSSSIVIHPPKMYNVQTRNHGSADSLASVVEDPSLQVEDQGHSTTMATITGRQSISKAISQRLSRTRTRSRDVLSSASGNVVIGVAVQEATVEHHEEDGDETAQATVVKSVVEGPETIRRQRSAPKLDGSQSNWMSKARELTSRFKRKSMAALSQVS